MGEVSRLQEPEPLRRHWLGQDYPAVRAAFHPQPVNADRPYVGWQAGHPGEEVDLLAALAQEDGWQLRLPASGNAGSRPI